MLAAGAVLPLYSRKFRKGSHDVSDTTLVSPQISDISFLYLETETSCRFRNPRGSPKTGCVFGLGSIFLVRSNVGPIM
jgi:hypothetical protein